jgi:hypothetical protein
VQSLKFTNNIIYGMDHETGIHDDMMQFDTAGSTTDTPYHDPITGRDFAVWIEGNVGIQLVGQTPEAVQGIPFLGSGGGSPCPNVLIRRNLSWGCGANGGSLQYGNGLIDNNFYQGITGSMSDWAPLTLRTCTDVVVTNSYAAAFSAIEDSSNIVGIGPSLDAGNNTILPAATSNNDVAARNAFIKANNLPHSIPDYLIDPNSTRAVPVSIHPTRGPPLQMLPPRPHQDLRPPPSPPHTPHKEPRP